jgi:hypothetical protein
VHTQSRVCLSLACGHQYETILKTNFRRNDSRTPGSIHLIFLGLPDDAGMMLVCLWTPLNEEGVARLVLGPKQTARSLAQKQSVVLGLLRAR